MFYLYLMIILNQISIDIKGRVAKTRWLRFTYIGLSLFCCQDWGGITTVTKIVMKFPFILVMVVPCLPQKEKMLTNSSLLYFLDSWFYLYILHQSLAVLLFQNPTTVDHRQIQKPFTLYYHIQRIFFSERPVSVFINLTNIEKKIY